ncbi:MAG: hypothetical protein PHI37_04260 [Candidatus Gracilibacteria bacterium]|nr:hypothetical protein [Candidatus Gracilibacteria bacterium]
MENSEKVEGQNRIINKESISRLDITSANIANKIFLIIDSKNKKNGIDSKTENFKELKEIVLLYFAKLIERRKNMNLLGSYYDKSLLRENKLIWKIEKNIMIYLPILVNYISNNMDGKTDEEVRFLIKESFKKMIILFFIYGDKTNLSLFNEGLKLDIEVLKQEENDFLKKQETLEDDESKIRKGSSIDTDLSVNDLFTRTYRSILGKRDTVFLYKKTVSKNTLINNIISEEIKITYKSLYNLFLKTLEINLSLNIRLNKIKESFELLFGMINSFKKLGILSQDFLINENGRFNNKYFISFIDGIEGKNLDLKKFIENYRNDIKHKKPVKNKKEISDKEFQKITFLNLMIQQWLEFSTDQKYIFFLKKVLRLDDGNITIPKRINFKRTKEDTYTKNFTSKYNYSFQEFIGYMKFFESRKNFKLSDLIEKDIDKFIFLYNWFEFSILNGSTNIKRPDFLKDIIKKLKSNGEIDGDEYLKLKGDLYNLSAVSTGKQINYIFRDLSRGNIQISDLHIGNVSFKNNVSLYCSGDKSNIIESLDYLNIAINACISVLNGRKLSVKQSKYIKILQDFNILPENLEKLSLLNKDNLIKLISGLKIVKGKIEDIQQMKDISEKDSDIVSNLFSNVGLETDNFNEKVGNKIGPEKNFGRVLIKLIKNYDGDFHKIGDLNRFRIVGRIGVDDENSIEKLIKKIIGIKDQDGVISVSFENEAGHLLSNPPKKTAYRDFKANILLTSGNIVEVQIHFKEMIEVKAGDYDLDTSTKYSLERKNSLLTSAELNDFIDIYESVFGKLPSKNLVLNISNVNESQLENYRLGNGQINCDMIYKINRSLDQNNSLSIKLTMLERILFNNVWSKIVIRYLSRLGINFLSNDQ